MSDSDTGDPCLPHADTVPGHGDRKKMLRGSVFFMVFISLAACTQGLSVNGLVKSSLSTIEKRFHIQSKETGFISSASEVSTLLAVIPVTYLGGLAASSKPRWIASGLIIMSLGCILWTVPNFLDIPDQNISAGRRPSSVISPNTTFPNLFHCSTGCISEDQGFHAKYLLVFVFAQLLLGLGSAPLSLANNYLDETLDSQISPLYISIFQIWFVIGPGLGYLLGSQLLNLPEHLIQQPYISSTTHWIGAWWPGFLLASICALISSAGLFLQSKMPDTLKGKQELPDHPLPSNLSSTIVGLFHEPIYIFICLGAGMDKIHINGLATFLPKYMEHQFRLSPSWSVLVVGMIIIPAAGGGTLFGGWLIKHLNLRQKGIILWILFSQLISVPFIFSLLLSCPELQYMSHVEKDQICSGGCNCPNILDNPVCASEGIMYLYPCLTNCSLAEETKCPSDCNYIIPVFILQVFSLFLTFSAIMPSLVASMRSISGEKRPLALGLREVITKILGYIPGPILFGFLIDFSCTHWEPDCGNGSTCLVYDNTRMAYLMVILCTVAKLFSIILYAMAFYSYKDI